MATNPATIRQRKATAAVTPTPALIYAAADSPAPSPPPSFYSIILKMLYVLPFFYVAYYLATYQWFPRPPLPDSYAVCSAWGSQPQIHTLDANNTVAECVVVSHGRVVHTGTLESVRRGYGDDSAQDGGIGVWITRLKRGQMLIPGLIDAHAHVLQNGESVTAVDLVGSSSVQDVVERIAAWIVLHPEVEADRSQFILGLGWDQTKWDGGAFPTAEDLEQDPRLKGRPIYLKRIDVHALWVSKSILSKVGSLPETVPGGLVLRTPSGDPSGIFIDNAMAFIAAVIPPWTDSQRLSFLQTTANQMLTTGLTSVHDASLSLADIKFLKALDKEGQMPVRIYGMVYCEPINTFCGDDVERYDGDKFTLRAVKIFTDGALGSFGAAMLEPYSDRPDLDGIMISEEKVFAPLIQRWINKGFQVNSHAIGDRANKVILDAYEQAVPDLAARDLRLRIEHAQIMTMSDIERIGRLGVIASIQPTHATSDRGYAEDRLGPERIKGAYAWQSLIENGTRLALGSDFPVEGVDPLAGIYAAVYRENWYPNERLSMLQTLRGFTIDAAFASFQEGRVGSLEVGKEADFVILSKNLYGIKVGKILAVQRVATVLAGVLVHGRLDL